MGFPQRNSRTNQPDLRLCQQTRLEINDLHRPRERLSIHLINWRATSIGIASAAHVVGRSGRGPVFPRAGSFPDRDLWDSTSTSTITDYAPSDRIEPRFDDKENSRFAIEKDATGGCSDIKLRKFRRRSLSARHNDDPFSVRFRCHGCSFTTTSSGSGSDGHVARPITRERPRSANGYQNLERRQRNASRSAIPHR